MLRYIAKLFELTTAARHFQELSVYNWHIQLSPRQLFSFNSIPQIFDDELEQWRRNQCRMRKQLNVRKLLNVGND